MRGKEMIFALRLSHSAQLVLLQSGKKDWPADSLLYLWHFFGSHIEISEEDDLIYAWKKIKCIPSKKSRERKEIFFWKQFLISSPHQPKKRTSTFSSPFFGFLACMPEAQRRFRSNARRFIFSAQNLMVFDLGFFFSLLNPAPVIIFIPLIHLNPWFFFAFFFDLLAWRTLLQFSFFSFWNLMPSAVVCGVQWKDNLKETIGPK